MQVVAEETKIDTAESLQVQIIFYSVRVPQVRAAAAPINYRSFG